MKRGVLAAIALIIAATITAPPASAAVYPDQHEAWLTGRPDVVTGTSASLSVGFRSTQPCDREADINYCTLSNTSLRWTIYEDGVPFDSGYKTAFQYNAASPLPAEFSGVRSIIPSQNSLRKFTPGKTYRVETLFTTGSVTSDYAFTFTTKTETPDNPHSVEATQTDGTATITWAAPDWTGTSAITGYEVLATPGGQVCETVETSCTADLTSGVATRFTVVAVNGSGPSSASDESNAVTWTAPNTVTVTETQVQVVEIPAAKPVNPVTVDRVPAVPITTRVEAGPVRAAVSTYRLRGKKPRTAITIATTKADGVFTIRAIRPGKRNLAWTITTNEYGTGEVVARGKTKGWLLQVVKRGTILDVVRLK